MKVFRAGALAVGLTAISTVAALAVTVVESNAPVSWTQVDISSPSAPVDLTGIGSFDSISIASQSSGPLGFRSPFDPGSTGFPGLAGWEDLQAFTVGSYDPRTLSPAILTLDTAQTILSFLWGSVDLYNSVELWNDGVFVTRVTGQDIFNADPGVLDAVGAAFVTITGFLFDEVHFRSDFGGSRDTAAFEFAGISAVPLPAGGLLLLGALGGFAVLRRRKPTQA